MTRVHPPESMFILGLSLAKGQQVQDKHFAFNSFTHVQSVKTLHFGLSFILQPTYTPSTD